MLLIGALEDSKMVWWDSPNDALDAIISALRENGMSDYRTTENEGKKELTFFLKKKNWKKYL